MLTPAQRFNEAILDWFTPGALYTFVGAGGKSTAIRTIAAIVVKSGVKARMTTTTRVGVEEFSAYPLRTVERREELLEALQDAAPPLLLAAGQTADHLKYRGIDPVLLRDIPPGKDMVVLVEGDGSRRLPMKAPREHEPVIPPTSAAVLAVMGAGAFGEPVDAAHCYNHERALEILGASECRFQGPEIAALAADRNGFRKGVLPGMTYRVLVNQSEREDTRRIAREALRIMRRRYGVEGALVSFEKGEMYDPD